MSYEQVASAFHARIDAIAQSVDVLAPGLEAAASLIVDAALKDARVFLCGAGEDSGLAAHAADRLRRGGDGAPALPVLGLTEGRGGENHGASDLWRDLRALSRDGDILIFLDCGDSAALALEGARIARERNLSAIVLSYPADFGTGAVALPLTGSTRSLRQELALMAMNTLHTLILQILTGET